VNGVRIEMLRFADDIAIRAREEINLKRTLESFGDILKSKYKTKINSKKTEVMVCSKDPENINNEMDDDVAKQVPPFKYVDLQQIGKIEKTQCNELKKLKLFE